MHIQSSLKRLVILLALSFPFLSGCVEKQDRVFRVAILSGQDGFTDIAKGFKTGMKDLGYIENKNITYDIRKANNNPDLIFAFPTAMTAKRAAQRTDIPVVFALADMEVNKLIESLHRPGGNLSGVWFPGVEATGKRLEILHEFMPGLKRVLITYDPSYPTITKTLEELHSIAAMFRITLVEEPIKDLQELDALLGKRTMSNHIDFEAVLIMPEVLTQSPEGWAMISRFAAYHRLPIAGDLCHTAKEGALFAYAPDLSETGMLAAPIADKVLKVVPAGKIMVATPNCRLWLNQSVAKGLGLEVSKALLGRADEIIL